MRKIVESLIVVGVFAALFAAVPYLSDLVGNAIDQNLSAYAMSAGRVGR